MLPYMVYNLDRDDILSRFSYVPLSVRRNKDKAQAVPLRGTKFDHNIC